MPDIPPAPKPEAKGIGFGLGCIQFVPKAEWVESLSVAQYLSDLEDSLRSLHAVSEVEAENRSDLTSENIHGKLPLIRDGCGCLFPDAILRIRVKLHIPHRIQDEIREGMQIATNTEDFVLRIYQEYSSSVAVIEALSPSATMDGADCVYLIREFLSKAMDESDSCRMRLDFLGPSPFHADFVILPADEEQCAAMEGELIRIKITRRIGYDKIEWLINDKALSLEAAKRIIYRDLAHEADLFYEVQQRRVALFRSWHRAQVTALNAIRVTEGLSLANAAKTYAKRLRSLREAILAVSEFRMMDISTRSELKREFARHVPSEYGAVTGYVKQEIDDIEVLPATELSNMLQFIESRSHQLDNRFVAVVASIIGGLVGGLLTLGAS